MPCPANKRSVQLTRVSSWGENHAVLAPSLRSCMEAAQGCNSTDLSCINECFLNVEAEEIKRCDTTSDLVFLAEEAMSNGKYSKWFSTLPYMMLRNMQEEISFINPVENQGGGV